MHPSKFRAVGRSHHTRLMFHFIIVFYTLGICVNSFRRNEKIDVPEFESQTMCSKPVFQIKSIDQILTNWHGFNYTTR